MQTKVALIKKSRFLYKYKIFLSNHLRFNYLYLHQIIINTQHQIIINTQRLNITNAQWQHQQKNLQKH
jgi:hypothetical protein